MVSDSLLILLKYDGDFHNRKKKQIKAKQTKKKNPDQNKMRTAKTTKGNAEEVQNK